MSVKKGTPETGKRTPTCVLLVKTLYRRPRYDEGVGAEDRRRLDLVVYGATPHGGALCCDATLVSPLTRTGHPQPCTVTIDGAALRVAEQRKHAAYPALRPAHPRPVLPSWVRQSAEATKHQPSEGSSCWARPSGTLILSVRGRRSGCTRSSSSCSSCHCRRICNAAGLFCLCAPSRGPTTHYGRCPRLSHEDMPTGHSGHLPHMHRWPP